MIHAYALIIVTVGLVAIILVLAYYIMKLYQQLADAYKLIRQVTETIELLSNQLLAGTKLLETHVKQKTH